MERQRRISAPFLRSGLNNYRQSKTTIQSENTIIALFQTEIADNIFSPIILGTAHTSRQDRDIIVLCHFVIRRIEYRCIPVTLFVIDRCCTVIGHNHRCCAAEEFKHVDMGLDPVPGPFVHKCFDERVLAVGHNAYKQPAVGEFTGIRIR